VDPITLIMTALAGGASRGLGEQSTGVARDAYHALKRTIVTRFAGDQRAETALDSYLEDPEAWNDRLESVLAETGAAADQAVIAAAQRLMALIDAGGAVVGKYTVNLGERLPEL